MTTKRIILGFFKGKCIQNEISLMIKRKGMEFRGIKKVENISENIDRGNLIVVQVSRKEEITKHKKFIEKNYKNIIIVSTSHQTNTSLKGKFHFINTPIKHKDFMSQIERSFKNLEGDEKKIKLGSFFFKSNELINTKLKKQKVKLTNLETKFLNYLYQKKEGSSKKELLAHVWGYNVKVETHTLESLVYRLRRKLEDDPNDPKVLLQKGKKYILRC